MAVTLNAKGTSVPYFKIGRKGTTIFQGTTDPNPTYSVSQGDIWIDTTSNEIKIRTASSTWASAAGGSVSALTDLTDIDLSTPATDGQILVWDNANSVFVAADEYGDTDVKTLLSSLDSSIIPSADVTYDLGSPTNQWKDIYVGPGSIYMSGTKIIEEDSVSGNLKFSAASNQSVHILSHGTGDTVLETSNGLDIIAHNSANIDLQVSTGQITFTGDVLANNDLTVTGNLTINGTTTTVNTATLTVSDNIIVLNNDETGTPSQDAGIEIERGTETNVAIAWNETTDRWTFTNDGSTYANLPLSTDELTEGSTNLYYTDARVGAYLTANPQPGNTYGTQIVWNVADPTNSIILDAGDGSTTQATYYGDVVDSNGSVVLDISGPAFYGSTNGNHNGDVYDTTGSTLILDVDNGQGTAVLNGDVNGTNITTSNIDVSNYIKGYNSLIAPGAGATVNYVVTVAAKTTAHRYNGTGSSSGYVFNGLESPFLTLTPGRTYRFIQEDATNSGHPIAFYFEADKTTAYTDNVTFNGTPGQAGAYTEITITDSTPAVLHYQCTAHGYMGNSLQTNTRNLTGWTTDNLIEGTNEYYTDQKVEDYINTQIGSAGEFVIVDTDDSTLTSTSALSINTTNGYLGINETNPAHSLHISSDAASGSQIVVEQYDDSADSPDIIGRKSRGSSDVPAATVAGDQLLRIDAQRYDGSGWLTMGSHIFETDSTSAAKATYKLQTNDGSGVATRLSVNEDGNIIIPGDLTVTGTINGAVTVSSTASNVTVHGDAQNYTKQYVLYGTTTDATETEIWVGGTLNNQIPVATNATMFYDIQIVARRTDAINESAGFAIKGVVDNFAGTVEDVGDLYEVIVATDNAVLAVDATADDINNSLKITVTGEASKTFKWTAIVKTTEVIG